MVPRLKEYIWTGPWEYAGTDDQRRLRRACASAQSRQSLRCSTKNQTSSPTGWPCMRVWRTSLRRTKSTISSYRLDLCHDRCDPSLSRAICFLDKKKRTAPMSNQNQWWTRILATIKKNKESVPLLIAIAAPFLLWAASWRNQQNDMCAQRRLRSAWACAQSDQSLRCPHGESLGP